MRSIPSWVAKHPDYVTCCNEVYESSKIGAGDPIEVLEKHKCLLTHAAWKVRATAGYSCENLTFDQQIYWSLQALEHEIELHQLHPEPPRSLK